MTTLHVPVFVIIYLFVLFGVLFCGLIDVVLVVGYVQIHVTLTVLVWFLLLVWVLVFFVFLGWGVLFPYPFGALVDAFALLLDFEHDAPEFLYQACPLTFDCHGRCFLPLLRLSIVRLSPCFLTRFFLLR